MKKKQIIQQQYFDLSVYLNSTNLVENRPKQMYFYIKIINSEKLFFAAITDWQKISLAYEKNEKHWAATGNTNFSELENAMAMWIPKCTKQEDLTKCIKNHIFSVE